MEIELNGLIDRIKKDGVQEADKKAQNIIKQAEDKAKGIISASQDSSKKIIDNAKKEADKLKSQAEDSIKQSVRDAALMLKQNITDIFDSIIKREVSKQIDTSVLKKSISKLIENFKPGKTLNIELLLSKEDKDNLQKAILDSLTEEMRKGINIKISPDIEKGFRIGEKDKNYYYDFTDEAITEALRQYLNPKLLEILNKGTK